MADINTSQLIDVFITEAQIANGMPAAWLEIQGRRARGVAGRPVRENKRMPRWTPEEDAFVLQNRSAMSLEEIGARLGRSSNAIKVRGYRIQAATPRRTPGYVSGNQIAQILGVDSHNPPAWIERGILVGEVIPYNQSRVWRRTTWPAFLRFLVRPTSWVYFKVEKIKNPRLRRLVELAQAKWGDRWLTTRQAADLRGCELEAIQNAILHGRLHGYHAGSTDRLRVWAWAQWFVLRSEVERLPLPWGCDKGHTIQWSPRADAFIVRACRERIAYEDMSRMMHWPVKRIQYRVLLLRRQGLIMEKKGHCQVSGRKSERMCSICAVRRTTGRGQTCGSDECLHELHRRMGKLFYAKTHPNYKTGIRAPRAPSAKIKSPKPPKPVRLCELCQILPAKPKGKFCSSLYCRAERIRGYARAAYQRKKAKKEGLNE
jgi:biotin operon repressor